MTRDELHDLIWWDLGESKARHILDAFTALETRVQEQEQMIAQLRGRK